MLAAHNYSWTAARSHSPYRFIRIHLKVLTRKTSSRNMADNIRRRGFTVLHEGRDEQGGPVAE
jgi:hypothetical protein